MTLIYLLLEKKKRNGKISKPDKAQRGSFCFVIAMISEKNKKEPLKICICKNSSLLVC